MSVVDNEGDLASMRVISINMTFQGAVNNNSEVMSPMAQE